MTCPYINTLERECGREATHDGFCGLHSVLHAFETDPAKLLNATVSDLHDALGALK